MNRFYDDEFDFDDIEVNDIAVGRMVVKAKRRKGKKRKEKALAPTQIEIDGNKLNDTRTVRQFLDDLVAQGILRKTGGVYYAV